jgi:hypothetical protein
MTSNKKFVDNLCKICSLHCENILFSCDNCSICCTHCLTTTLDQCSKFSNIDPNDFEHWLSIEYYIYNFIDRCMSVRSHNLKSLELSTIYNAYIECKKNTNHLKYLF